MIMHEKHPAGQLRDARIDHNQCKSRFESKLIKISSCQNAEDHLIKIDIGTVWKLLTVIPKQTTVVCRRTRGGLLHQLVTWKDQGAPVIIMMKLYVVMIMRMKTVHHHLCYNCHHHHHPPDRGLLPTTTIYIVTTSQSA